MNVCQGWRGSDFIPSFLPSLAFVSVTNDFIFVLTDCRSVLSSILSYYIPWNNPASFIIAMSQSTIPGPPDDDSLQHRYHHQRHHDLTESPTRIKMNRGVSIETKLQEGLSLPEDDGDRRNRVHMPSLQHPSPTTSSDAAANTADTTPRARNSNHHYHQQQQQAVQNGGGNTNSSTSMLSFGWLDRQRERRRRENLQQQAEEQLQKIVQAELAALHHRDQNHAINGNHHHHPHDDAVSSPDGPLPPPYRVTRDQSASSKNSEDLVSLDGSTTGRKIAAADVSKSGEGATAHLDLLSNVLLGMTTGTSEEEEIDEGDEEEFPVPPVRIETLDVDRENPFILNESQMQAIASHCLPKTIAFCRWRRLYGLNRDGDSFDACLRIVGTVQRTLMVIRTSKGEIFGGYADAPWHPNTKNGSAGFYGSAAACLFTFSDTYRSKQPHHKAKCSFKFEDDTPAAADADETTTTTIPPFSYINVYRWSGKNRYIQLCDSHNKMIAFGGGGDDGAFGVCVQDDFQRGSTGPCDTFDNDPLCESGSFDVVDVEFWEFLTGVF